MSSYWLPEDLLLDILARLPVESLLRFRCVSKPWVALIDSQEFVKMHLKQSIMNPNVCQFLSRTHRPFGQEHPEILSYNLYAAEFNLPENLIETWQETSPAFLKVENISLVGSCNGLLCICREGFNGRLLLYNPWTKKDWNVPDEAMFIFLRQYGFGYDDVNDDYKVISIYHFEVQVYSLKSNSWRRVQDLPYRISCIYNNGVGVLTNCSLHWLSYKTSAIREESFPDISILAIDLRTEKYHLVPLPECRERQVIEWLGVLNDCLSLVTDMCYSIIIWVMKDYGIKDSWTKLSTVVHSRFLLLNPTKLKPIAYSEIRKQLIFHYPGGFLWYNIETNLFDRIYFDASSGSINAFGCVQSLVQPCGGGSKGTFRHTKSKKKTLS